MENTEIYTDEYKIRTYSTDTRGLASVTSLLRMQDDIAGNHAILRGAGIEDMLKKGITWVLSRTETRFTRRPGIGEKIYGRTWPAEAKGLKACRDFHFTDENGDTVMKASTIWLIIDLKNRRPMRVEPVMEQFRLHEERSLGGEPVKLTFKSPEPDTEGVRVPYSALDLNDHVNNVYYISRAMDCIPEEIRDGMEIEGIIVNFISECFKGDILKVGSHLDGTKLNQTVFREKEEVCRIQTYWKQNN